MGYTVDNRFDAVLNKERLDQILQAKGYGGYGGYKEFWTQITKRYDLGLKYGSFMGLVHNDASWRLLYAFALCEFLDVKMNDVFCIIEMTEDVRNKRQRGSNRKQEIVVSESM